MNLLRMNLLKSIESIENESIEKHNCDTFIKKTFFFLPSFQNRYCKTQNSFCKTIIFTVKNGLNLNFAPLYSVYCYMLHSPDVSAECAPFKLKEKALCLFRDNRTRRKNRYLVLLHLKICVINKEALYAFMSSLRLAC